MINKAHMLIIHATQKARQYQKVLLLVFFILRLLVSGRFMISDYTFFQHPIAIILFFNLHELTKKALQSSTKF